MAGQENGDTSAIKRLSAGVEVGWRIIGIVGAVTIWFITLEVRLARNEWQHEFAASERARLQTQLQAERTINEAQAQALNRFEVTVGVLNEKLQRALDEVGVKRP